MREVLYPAASLNKLLVPLFRFFEAGSLHEVRYIFEQSISTNLPSMQPYGNK